MKAKLIYKGEKIEKNGQFKKQSIDFPKDLRQMVLQKRFQMRLHKDF